MFDDKENLSPEIVSMPEKKLSGGAQTGIPSWSEYMKMLEAEGEVTTPVEEAPKPRRVRPPPQKQLSEEEKMKKERVRQEGEKRRREMREMMKQRQQMPKEETSVSMSPAKIPLSREEPMGPVRMQIPQSPAPEPEQFVVQTSSPAVNEEEREREREQEKEKEREAEREKEREREQEKERIERDAEQERERESEKERQREREQHTVTTEAGSNSGASISSGLSFGTVGKRESDFSTQNPFPSIGPLTIGEPQDMALRAIQDILITYGQNISRHQEQQVAQAQTEISQIKASYEEQIAALHQKNQALQTAMLAWKAKSQALEAQNKTLKQKVEAQSVESVELTKLCEQLISKLEGM